MFSIYVTIIFAFQILLLLYVAFNDVATRLIPNRTCLLLAVLGVVGAVLVDPTQLVSSFGVTVLLFALLWIMHSRQWMGGGDVKLILALAIGFSSEQTLQLITIGALSGGVLAMVHLVMRQLPVPVAPSASSSLLRRVYAVERWRNLRHAPLPYGVAIACGGIWTILNHGV